MTKKNAPKAGCYPEKCPVSQLDNISDNRERKAEQTFQCGFKRIIKIIKCFQGSKQKFIYFFSH